MAEIDLNLKDRQLTFFDELKAEDISQIKEILASSGFFSQEEGKLALSLIEERLKIGEESGYYFLLLKIEGILIGYSCYGQIPCTDNRYDLYWIAIDQTKRGEKFGARLLEETQKRIQERGGKIIYAETASREDYLPTRRFYEKCGYKLEAILKDFYTDGDGKCIYKKQLY